VVGKPEKEFFDSGFRSLMEDFDERSISKGGNKSFLQRVSFKLHNRYTYDW